MLLLLKSVLRNLILPPAGPPLVLAVGFFLIKRRPILARVLLVFGIGFLWVLSTPIISDAITGLAEHYPPLDLSSPNGAQAIVILGGGGEITRAHESGGPAALPMLLEKVSYGAFVARKTGLPVLISGDGIDATAMRETLQRNFDTAVTWTDDQARDTFENARNSSRILYTVGIHRVILVTLGAHMLRSVREFNAAGIDCVPAPEGMISGRGHKKVLQYLPTAEALMYSSLAFYELLGERVREFFAATHIRRHDS
jgi:uncharacterized SAM-binding protein YcdF (DUF218 family)